MKKVFIFQALLFSLFLTAINISAIDTISCVRGNFDKIPKPFQFKNYYFDRFDKIWSAGGDGEIRLQWQPTNLKTKSDFNKIYFFDDNIGFVIGTKGGVFKTIDNGKSWTEQKVETDAELNEIVCLSNLNCWIAGNKGLILATQNGGQSWNRLETNVSNNLFSISFSDFSTGWAVGKNGLILKTTDSGKTWIKHFVDKSENDEFSKESDKGWARIENSWQTVFFKNQNEGCIAGLNRIACTSDGGENWQLKIFDGNERLNFVNFVLDSNRIIAIEECGSDSNSSDFGLSWNKLK